MGQDKMTNKMIQYYNRNKVREDTKKKFKEWYQTYAEFMNVIDLPVTIQHPI